MKTTPKQITIKTLTPKYDKHEDRIRLSLNYNDLHNRIDMILTRSFLLKILPSIEEFTYKYYPNEPIEEELSPVELTQQIKSDKINKTQKNKSSYLSSTNTDDLELYKGIEDLLWTLNMSYDNTTNLSNLTLESKNKHKAKLKCDIHTLKNIIKSIKQSVPTHSWSITL